MNSQILLHILLSMFSDSGTELNYHLRHDQKLKKIKFFYAKILERLKIPPYGQFFLKMSLYDVTEGGISLYGHFHWAVYVHKTVSEVILEAEAHEYAARVKFAFQLHESGSNFYEEFSVPTLEAQK